MITITIKGIPKETHRELKRRAAAHRRSLNNEVISVLESSVHRTPADVRAVIERARTVRAMMKFKGRPLDITKLIREGRDRH
jgi:antitoxin FitA